MLFCFKINFEGVFLSHDSNEMVHVFFICIFYAKIINYQTERDVTGYMFEETISGSCTDVSVFFEMFNKVLVCDETAVL